ncbi:hypothetical protein ACWNX4_00085 [Candidatus Vidania fulgoroideorum]
MLNFKNIIKKYAKGAKIMGSFSKNNVIKIKFGIDSTKGNLHIGHLFCLIIAKKISSAFKRSKLIIIVGDYTATIGNQLKYKDSSNFGYKISTFLSQVPFLRKAIFLKNGTWLRNVDINKLFIKSYNEKLKNHVKKKDLKNKVYPYLQSYDTKLLKPDIEVGGVDQLANFYISKKVNCYKTAYVMLPLILGDGKIKMSKSEKKCIYLRKNSVKLFWNIIRYNDENVLEFMKIFKRIYTFKIIIFSRKVDVNMSNKLNFFVLISEIIYGKNNIELVRKFLKNKLTEREYDIKLNRNLLEVFSLLSYYKIIKSRSDYKRKIKNGLIKINDKTLLKSNKKLTYEKKYIIKIGKKIIVKINV